MQDTHEDQILISTDVSVIIVNYHSEHVLKECLKCLDSSDRQLEVSIVNNSEIRLSREQFYTTRNPLRIIENERNVGFGAACNRAASYSRADTLIFLNPDAFVSPSAVKNAINFLALNKSFAICGGLLMGPDGLTRPSARKFPSLWRSIALWLGKQTLSECLPCSQSPHLIDQAMVSTDWVPGVFFAISRETFMKLGGFDERFFLYFEEVDLCRRAQLAGYRVACLPSIRVKHLGGESSRSLNTKEGVFTNSGRQVLRFQLMSEFLYYRKYQGFVGIFLCAWLHLVWQTLRILKRRLHRRKNDRIEMGVDPYLVLKEVIHAAFDTRLGKRSPPKPWLLSKSF